LFSDQPRIAASKKMRNWYCFFGGRLYYGGGVGGLLEPAGAVERIEIANTFF
jgi:hypothetical protein